jgi:preprotein translocase subunit YajC
MSTFALITWFAMGQPPQPGQAVNQTAQMLQSLGLMVVLFVVMYVVMIRPQQIKAKEQDKLLKSLKRGDKVITSSGIVGVVVAVNDRTITLRSADTKLELLKSAVTDITERSGDTAEA